MFLKPVTGRVVRDPVKGTLLPEKGDEVPDSSFWRRRLQDGDVELVTLKTQPEPVDKKEKSKS